MACVRRKRTKPLIAVECSPADGACAVILLTNSVLASSADDLAIFCAGFGTVLFLFPRVLLTQQTVHKIRISNRIRQRIGSIGKAQVARHSISLNWSYRRDEYEKRAFTVPHYSFLRDNRLILWRSRTRFQAGDPGPVHWGLHSSKSPTQTERYTKQTARGCWSTHAMATCPSK